MAFVLALRPRKGRRAFSGFQLSGRLVLQADPAERYSQASKLLTLDIDIPSDLLAAAGPPAEAADPDGLTRAEAAGHLRLIQVQYLQVSRLHSSLNELYAQPSIRLTCAFNIEITMHSGGAPRDLFGVDQGGG